MLVQVVKSHTSKRQTFFLSENRLRLELVRKGRYRVLKQGTNIDGDEVFYPLGYTFFEGGYCIFVPYRKMSPNYWYFGITRCDAISGYLSANLAAAPADQKEA